MPAFFECGKRAFFASDAEDLRLGPDIAASTLILIPVARDCSANFVSGSCVQIFSGARLAQSL